MIILAIINEDKQLKEEFGIDLQDIKVYAKAGIAIQLNKSIVINTETKV